MTKDGIEYDFNKTPYEVSKKYNGSILTYKFSSEFYKNKFIILSRESRVNKKLKLLGINYDETLLHDIKLYSLIEKRGFQIVTSHLTKINKISDLKIKISYDVY